MGKWIALALIVIGIALLIRAATLQATSFDDGTFLLRILIGLIGAGLVLVGIIWLGALAFVAL